MSPIESRDVSAIAVDALEILRRRRAEFVEFVLALARAESPSTAPASQGEARALVEEALGGLGLDVRRIAGVEYGDHVLGSPDGTDPGQLLLGHLDTVWPLGTLDTMPAEVDGDRLRGPGVFDMKGGLAVGVFALRALEELAVSPAVPTGFLVTAEEEIGSPESEPLIVDLARRVKRVYVLEPALGETGRIKTRRKGVGHFRVTVTGVSSHAGLAPQAGASAISELARLIRSLTALTDYERGVTVNVGVIEGGTRANVVAERATAEVDVRVRSVADARRVESEIAALTPSDERTTIEVVGAVDRDPLERTPRNQALWEEAAAIGRAIGVELTEGESGGASDGNFTSAYTATLDGLGAVGDGAHAAHEFLYVDRTIERAAILAGLLALPA
ncbi:MAG: M20 family metallopeptidase [Gemmatimonadetes bacterium]|nr:M20 family metallopeptidase [Gemmatimonadota bacterium]